MNELTHAAAAFLLPPTGAILPLLLAWLLRHYLKRLAALLFVFGLAVIWLTSSEMGAQWLQDQLLGVQKPLDLRRLAEQPAGRPVDRSPEKSVIVVLGGGARVQMPEYGSAQLKPMSIERLRYGIWLSRRTGSPLLFSGGAARDAQPGQPTEAALAALTAQLEFGFSIRHLEDRSTDTRENARYTAELLKDKQLQRVILVTNDVHMRRAMRAFRAALPPEMELVAAPMGLNLRGFEWRDLLPSTAGITRSRYLGYEWLGWVANH